MFTIFTECSSEKDILQQDFATFNDRFHLKIQEAPAIAGILRSISYQLFQTAPPSLAQLITQMAADSLHLKLSLALYRQVLATIKKTERMLTLYRQYFLSLSRLVDSPAPLETAPSLSALDQETSAICALQLLDPSPSQHCLITDFQDQLQRGLTNPSPPSPTHKTKQTAEPDLMDECSTREKLDLTNKQVLLWEGEEWWKARDQPADSSRELSRFEKHGKEGNLLQHSITGLMAEQAKFQRQREEELARKNKRSQESICLRFNKRMREKLVQAKLKRRKR